MLEVDSTDQLKVKQHTIIFTDQKGDSGLGNGDEDDIVQTSYHITVAEADAVEEDDHEDFEIEVDEAPPELEDGGQATMDELKEINLGTREDPRPIFVSASLSSAEEKEYLYLLLEYKDVFAWTYKEMPGLDPNGAFHQLAVKPEARPTKQTQRRFRT